MKWEKWDGLVILGWGLQRKGQTALLLPKSQPRTNLTDYKEPPLGVFRATSAPSITDV